MSTVTTGMINGKLYRISSVTNEEESHYEVSIYNRDLDQFVKEGSDFNTVDEANAYLEETYG